MSLDFSRLYYIQNVFCSNTGLWEVWGFFYCMHILTIAYFLPGLLVALIDLSLQAFILIQFCKAPCSSFLQPVKVHLDSNHYPNHINSLLYLKLSANLIMKHFITFFRSLKSVQIPLQSPRVLALLLLRDRVGHLNNDILLPVFQLFLNTI